MIEINAQPSTETKFWMELVSSSTYAEYKSAITNLHIYGSVNGGTPSEITGATAVFNSTMDMFLVTIPGTSIPASGSILAGIVTGTDIIDGKFRIYVSDIDGDINTIAANVSAIKSNTDNLTLLDIESVVRTALETYGTASANDVTSAINDIKGVDWTPTNTLKTIYTNVDNIGSNVVLIKTNTDKITPYSIFAKTSEAMSVYGVPTKLEIDDSFSQVKGVGWTATDSLKSIKDGQTSLISSIDWSMIKKCLIMEIGNYTLPAGGGAGTYTISLAGVGTATFTVDSKGDRTLNNITLV